jgi:RNA polymerase sigma-70 factor, ECF subfamily
LSVKGDLEAQYAAAALEFGPALERLARAYEMDPDKRRDLLQEIHLQLWRSFSHFDGRCSLRTWVYRVAHYTATSHILREKQKFARLQSIEDLDFVVGELRVDALSDAQKLKRLTLLIQKLRPLDRQLILGYLEGMDASAIGEITGLSAGNVATRIHRIKKLLAQWFEEGRS